MSAVENADARVDVSVARDLVELHVTQADGQNAVLHLTTSEAADLAEALNNAVAEVRAARLARYKASQAARRRRPERRERVMSALDERLLLTGEVARMFNVTPKTVARWARDGKLEAIFTLGGHRRYRETDVKMLLAGKRDAGHAALSLILPALFAVFLVALAVANGKTSYLLHHLPTIPLNGLTVSAAVALLIYAFRQVRRSHLAHVEAVEEARALGAPSRFMTETEWATYYSQDGGGEL